MSKSEYPCKTCGGDMFEVGHDDGIQGTYYCYNCGTLKHYDLNDEYWEVPKIYQDIYEKCIEVEGIESKTAPEAYYLQVIKSIKDKAALAELKKGEG